MLSVSVHVFAHDHTILASKLYTALQRTIIAAQYLPWAIILRYLAACNINTFSVNVLYLSQIKVISLICPINLLNVMPSPKGWTGFCCASSLLISTITTVYSHPLLLWTPHKSLTSFPPPKQILLLCLQRSSPEEGLKWEWGATDSSESPYTRNSLQPLSLSQMSTRSRGINSNQMTHTPI